MLNTPRWISLVGAPLGEHPGNDHLNVGERAGHFVQEDAGPQLAELINDFIAGQRFIGFRVVDRAADQ